MQAVAGRRSYIYRHQRGSSGIETVRAIFAVANRVAFFRTLDRYNLSIGKLT